MTRVARLCSVGVLAASTLAAAAAVDRPSAPPATVPTIMPAQTAPRVYVGPFTTLPPGDRLAWTGPAVQRDLVADLARAGYRTTTADADAAAAASADATTAARVAGAAYAVAGTCQMNSGQVRLTAAITNIASGQTLAALSATGKGQDLFALEDRLSAQVVDHLRHDRPTDVAAPRTPRVPAALQPAAVAAALQPPAGGVGSHYQGSALQSYVDANRTPSQDYTQQVVDARDRSTLGSYTSGTLGGGGNGFGGLGYGGLGFGGGGYGFGLGSGGYLLGVSYPVGSVGTFGGGGGYGYQGFGGGFRGGFSFAGGRGSIGFGGGFGRGGGGFR